MSPEQAVAEYIACKRSKMSQELNFYVRPILAETIASACGSIGDDGKMASHQRRIGRVTLAKIKKRLLRYESEIKSASSFEQLLSVIEALCSGPKAIKGVGELTTYDIALRIGVFLGFQPKQVYLHAGARAGAKKLVEDVGGTRSIRRSSLPEPFKKLSPAECENCLCIFFAPRKRRAKRKAMC